MRDIQAQLEAIQDRSLVYPQDGKVVYQSIIQSQYPDVDIPLLCDLLADSLFDWDAATKGYVSVSVHRQGGKAL